MVRKILSLIGFVLGVIFILGGLYIIFNIYFVMSCIDGQCYDGFGTPYGRDGEPSSPYFLIGLVLLGVGGYIANFCKKVFKNTKK